MARVEGLRQSWCESDLLQWDRRSVWPASFAGHAHAIGKAMSEHAKEFCAGLRFAVVVPTFNHGGPLPGVLAALDRLALPIIVVDDGSADGSADFLRGWIAPDIGRHLVTHAVNQGKSAALASGFVAALRLECTHTLTVDADGQHSVDDVPIVMDRSQREPMALIVGARPARMDGCPWTSRFGRWVSNALIRVSSGARVTDSQSGMRSYPLAFIAGLKVRAGRYAFETEVLVRAAWAGLGVLEVPISGTYAPAGGRVTHFRIGRDTRQAIGMHLRLLARSIRPGDPVARVIPRRSMHDGATGTLVQRAWWWLGPSRFVQMARGDPGQRKRLAASVAVGLFMAAAPLYGIKTAACVALSMRFRLHPAVVIGISSLSTPPLGFVFALAGLAVGHLALHGRWPEVNSLPRWSEFDPAFVRDRLAEWIIGSVLAGAVLAGAGYVVARALLAHVARAAPGGGEDR